MKKIIGSFIAAAAIWAGTTAFVGTQMESGIQEQVKNSNQLYANSGIKYKINSYEKNFLESTAKVEVEFLDPAVLELIKDTIKLPLVVEYKIEHGPLFFTNGLGFGAARTHQEIPVSSLLTKEAKTEFLDLIKEDVIITSDMIISFFKNASYTASSNQIKINEDGKSLLVTPLEINGDIHLETFQGENHINIDSVEFKEEQSQNGLQLNNLTINIGIDDFIEKTLMIGGIDLSIENLIIKDDSNPQLENIDIATDLHILTTKNSATSLSTLFKGNVDFKNTKLPAELPNLKSIHATMDMKEVGIEGMLTFQKATQEMQESQSKLITKMQSNPGEDEMQKIFEEFGVLQETMMSKIVHALNTLLIKDKTSISYALEMETRDSKKSNAKVEVGYTGDMKFQGSIEEIAMKAQQQALDMISLNVDLTLDSDHLKNIPDADILMQQVQMGVAQGFVKEVNGKFVLNGYYKNQELMVNDNNLTANVLPLLMMATQGGGF